MNKILGLTAEIVGIVNRQHNFLEYFNKFDIKLKLKNDFQKYVKFICRQQNFLK